MITVADTPGFGDSDGRDPLFQQQIKEYIEDLSDRLGIDAFLLVFKYNSPRFVGMVICTQSLTSALSAELCLFCKNLQI